MTTNLARAAATLTLPVVLLLGVTACGDEGSSEPEAAETTTSSSPTTDASAPETPDLGDVPDPRTDPDGFRDYLTGVYTDAGMSEKQATCMSDAFMDNVDLDKITDASAVTSMMNDSKLQDAIVACM
jgi:hypothetical protein